MHFNKALSFAALKCYFPLCVITTTINIVINSFKLIEIQMLKSLSNKNEVAWLRENYRTSAIEAFYVINVDWNRK